MRVGAAAGLMGAVVFGLLAVTQMETLIASINGETTGALNTTIGSFNFLLILVVVGACVALLGVVVTKIGR